MHTDQILKELSIKAVRSKGPGGQHVNKTSTQVQLHFNIAESLAFTEDEKQRIQKKLSNKINVQGNLVLSCGETRSQFQNKAKVIQRLFVLLEAALKKNKPRKASKPSKTAIEKRLKSKRVQALKKTNRKKTNWD